MTSPYRIENQLAELKHTIDAQRHELSVAHASLKRALAERDALQAEVERLRVENRMLAEFFDENELDAMRKALETK